MLRAGAPGADDDEEVGDIHDAVKVEVVGRVPTAPPTDDCQQVVDIHNPVTIGISQKTTETDVASIGYVSKL